MSRTTTAAIVVGAALAVALLAMLRVVIDQQNTVTQLRQTLERQTAPPQNEPTSVAQPNVQAVLQESTSPPNVVTESRTAGQPTEKVSVAVPIDMSALRQEKENLERRLSITEEELANVKRVSAQPEDMDKAYSGPGTWINTNPSSRYLTGITITGDGMVRTIKAWQNKFEWSEVPFFLLSFGEPAGTAHRQYWRGFAAWSGERSNRYLLITFEPTGLKVDLINIPTDGEAPGIRLFRTIEHMTRSN